jgi:Protein of unknown function (DUF3047)
LKRSLFYVIILFLVLNVVASPLAMVVLNTATAGANRLPSDWQIKVTHGKPDISVCRDNDVACVHMKSVKASFGLEKSVDVDPAQMPFLTWRWKVTQLPPGGDFRHPSTDDQAAQVLIAFADHRILSYIWDSNAPKGIMENASSIPLVRIFAVVCESGAEQANRWTGESRNLATDYQQAYGKFAPHVKGVRIQINSQHTATVAESYFGEVAFRSVPQ